ncbi:MAG: hypothetical protein RIQ92_1222 [Actinomycetota bacterium]
MKTRLDAELVRRELARSREQAADLIESRSVLVNGIPATKPATQVDAQTSIVIQGDRDDFVSRGGHKLAGALDVFTEVVVEGKICLDAGASTGGFTDVLLRRGAKKVVAVDVGYGQLAWELRTDERVTVLDRTNIRHLTGDQVGEEIALVVADLSFISLSLVLPALAAVSRSDADFVLMVKPQFEVGREKLGAGGVVRDPELRKAAVLDVADSAYDVGLGTMGIAPPPGDPARAMPSLINVPPNAMPVKPIPMSARKRRRETWPQGKPETEGGMFMVRKDQRTVMKSL